MVDQDRFTRTAASGWAPSARAIRDRWAVDLLGGKLERSSSGGAIPMLWSRRSSLPTSSRC